MFVAARANQQPRSAESLLSRQDESNAVQPNEAKVCVGAVFLLHP